MQKCFAHLVLCVIGQNTKRHMDDPKTNLRAMRFFSRDRWPNDRKWLTNFSEVIENKMKILDVHAQIRNHKRWYEKKTLWRINCALSKWCHSSKNKFRLWKKREGAFEKHVVVKLLNFKKISVSIVLIFKIESDLQSLILRFCQLSNYRYD